MMILSAIIDLIVIARSDSDDPSTLAAQATPGWESAEARRAKAEASQLSCCGKAGLLRFARNDGGNIRARSRGAIFCPGSTISVSLSEERARGKPGADCARSAVCRNCET